MTLSKIELGNNKFCGPAVIAALLNMSTDQAAKEYNLLRRKPLGTPVKIVDHRENLAILTKHGFKLTPIISNATIFYVFSCLPLSKGIYLARTPGHVVLIEKDDNGIFFLDNHTKIPINLAASAQLGNRITHLHKVER